MTVYNNYLRGQLTVLLCRNYYLQGRYLGRTTDRLCPCTVILKKIAFRGESCQNLIIFINVVKETASKNSLDMSKVDGVVLKFDINVEKIFKAVPVHTKNFYLYFRKNTNNVLEI